MRKVLHMIALLTSIIFLTGCGGRNDIHEDKESSVVHEDSTIQNQKEETDKEANKDINEEIEQKIIFDADGLRVTVLGLSDSSLGTELKLLVENDTDKDYTVQARDVSINDMMLHPIMSIDVAAGKNANDSMDIPEWELEKEKINSIENIEFRLHIIESENFENAIESDLINLEFDNKKSEQSIPEGDMIVDQNGVRIISTGVVTESAGEVKIEVYLENNSDLPVTVQVRDVSVNSFMIHPIFSCDLMPGKRVYDSIDFFQSDLDENEIDKIDTLELSFAISETDKYDSILETDSITIKLDY